MNRGTYILFLVLFGFPCNLFSQQLSHQVLVSGAGVASNGTLSFSQTIGETAVEILNGSDFVLTQGFQQPRIKLSNEKSPKGNGVKVYPNPATDYIKIELFGEVAHSFRIEIINITGTIIHSEKIVFTTQYWNIKDLPVNEIMKGMYFVRVISDDGLINRTFKIEKL